MIKEENLNKGLKSPKNCRESGDQIIQSQTQTPTAIIAALVFGVIFCLMALDLVSQLANSGLTNPHSALLFLLAVPLISEKMKLKELF